MEKSLLLRILSFICMAAGIVILAIGVVKYHEETIQQESMKEFKWDDEGQLNTDDIEIWTDEDDVVSDEANVSINIDSESGEDVTEELEDNSETIEDVSFAGEETVHEE